MAYLISLTLFVFALLLIISSPFSIKIHSTSPTTIIISFYFFDLTLSEFNQKEKKKGKRKAYTLSKKIKSLTASKVAFDYLLSHSTVILSNKTANSYKTNISLTKAVLFYIFKSYITSKSASFVNLCNIDISGYNKAEAIQIDTYFYNILSSLFVFLKARYLENKESALVG